MRKEIHSGFVTFLKIVEEVFMLFVFGGLSLKDISTIFGKSESWARVTYYRAKQKIMEGLGR